MEQLIQMVVIVALLYAGYTFGMKRWNYTSQADLAKRRAQLKAKGLSNTFYFIHAGTLFVLTVLSGGTFVFYWIYQQWKAICRGFKRTDGAPLSKGPFLRTLGSFFTFFTLGAIINRTCEYMHKSPTWPAAWWGCVWLAGLVTVFLPVDGWVRLVGALVFCWVPTVYQRHLNKLPKKTLALAPKPREIIAAAFGSTILAGLIILVHLLGQK